MSKSITTTTTSQGSSRQAPHDFNEHRPSLSNPISISVPRSGEEIPPDARIPYTFFPDPSLNKPVPTTSEDLYKDLSTFTFGATTPPTPSSSHFPSTSSENDDPLYPTTDATPRPSVSAVYDPNNEFIYARPQDNSDAASFRTFGVDGDHFSASSASVSVASFVSDARVVDGFYSTTSTTSAGGLTTQFSSDEYEEEDVDDVSVHQPTFANVGPGDDWDRLSELSQSSASGTSDLYGQRRGSLPMAIPGATPPAPNGFGEDFYGSGRNRENSAATIRRPSRSLDDDLQKFHAGPLRAGASILSTPGSGSSQPQSKGDWEMLESKGKSREHPQTIGSVVGVTPEPLSATHGFDADWMKDIQGGIQDMSDVAGFDSSASQPNPASARRPSTQSWLEWLSKRRPSAATIGTVEDTFFRQIYRWDDVYAQRRGEWSFKREKAEDGTATHIGRSSLSTINTIASPRGSFSTDSQTTAPKEFERPHRPKPSFTGMTRGAEEIWRCAFVGRYKVHRREVRPKTPSNSTKPPQQRLDIQPFADPFAKVYAPHGVPVTIHKHSRAIAFSIYRQRHRLPSSKRPSNARDGPSTQQSVAPARTSIMLAPKRVQEQYTSTRTTISLDTHGLLGDKASQPSTSERARSREYSRRQSASERDRSASKKDKDRKKRKEEDAMFNLLGGGKKEKDKKTRTPSASTSQTSSTGSVSSSRDEFVAPPPASAPIRPKDPAPIHKQQSSRSLRSSPSSSSRTLPVSPPSASPYSLPRTTGRRLIRDSDADDSDDEVQPMYLRTPHAEAFGSIDPSIIAEQKRQRPETRPHDDSSRSFLKRLARQLQRSVPNSASDGVFVAPWWTMAPRSQQEENERVVQVLNASFKGVGLLPSKPKPKSTRPKQPSGNTHVNIFEEVPPDSLYMLLPLWPGETDALSAQEHPHPKPQIPPEQRQYLLVYYVPFEQQDGTTRARTRKDPERRSRSSQTSSFEDKVTDEYGVLLSSFHCSARLVGYRDLHGSGVLAPDEGLFVTGPLSEAMKHLPSPSIRQEHQTDFVIGVSQSRERGFEFFPEGLDKMGMCYPVSTGVVEEPIPLPDEDETPEEPDLKLTPIGRAVVEMAWLGCLALTSFGTA